MVKNTQYGWIFIIVLIVINIIVLKFESGNSNYFYLLALSILILLQFYRLTIEINDLKVSYKLGIGLIHGSIPIKQIENCKPINYLPMGWGIRLRPGVILYNVSGNKAVEFIVKNKKRKIWLGTNNPQQICNEVLKRIDA